MREVDFTTEEGLLKRTKEKLPDVFKSFHASSSFVSFCFGHNPFNDISV